MERRDRISHLGIVFGLFALGALPPLASAGDWQLSNSLSLNTYASDNLRQRQDGEAGVAIDVRPTVSLRGTGRRVQGAITYTPSLYTSAGDDAPPSRLSHYLNALFNTELVRDSVFLDTAANAGLVTTGTFAGSGDSEFANRDESRQAFGFSLSPYTRHRFGSYAELSFRLGLDVVRSESDTSVIDSTGRSGSVILSSGRRFARFPWSLAVSRDETSYDSRTDVRDTVDGSLGYRIDRKWRVDGRLGYESLDVASGRSSTSGATYSATVFWTPNPRNRAELEVGHRYYGTLVRGRAEHRSRRTVLSVDVRREVTNARSQFLRAFTLGDLAASAGLDLADGQNPGSILGIQVLPLDEDFVNTQLTGRVAVSGRRTRVSLTGDWSDRKYEISPREDRVVGLTLTGSRSIGGRINTNATLSWQDVQSNLSGDSQYWRISAGASRPLGRHTRIALDLSRQQRTSDGSISEFTEHRVGVNLITRMF